MTTTAPTAPTEPTKTPTKPPKAVERPAPRNVVEAIIEVMRLVKAVGKDGRNESQGFNFRGIDGVLNAVGPAMRDVGLLCFPHCRELTASEVTVGQRNTKMSHQLLDITYRFTYSDADGEITNLDVLVHGESMDSGDKSVSKAYSVAYRTALIQTLSLPTTERDPDMDTYQRSDAPEPAAAAFIHAEIARLYSLPIVDAAGPAKALWEGEYGEAGLLGVVEVLVEGHLVTAEVAIRELSRRYQAHASGADAPSPAQDDEQGPPADARTVPYDDESEPLASPETVEKVRAVRDAALNPNAQPPAAPEPEPAAAAPLDGRTRALNRWLAECGMHAEVLGVTIEDYLQPVLEQRALADLAAIRKTVAPSWMGAWTVARRPQTIKVLSESGRTAAAERLSAVEPKNPAIPSAILNPGEASS